MVAQIFRHGGGALSQGAVTVDEDETAAIRLVDIQAIQGIFLQEDVQMDGDAAAMRQLLQFLVAGHCLGVMLHSTPGWTYISNAYSFRP